MIRFVEELPTEWQQQWDQITQNSGLPRERLISMFLLPTAYYSFHFRDKIPPLGINDSAFPLR